MAVGVSEVEIYAKKQEQWRKKMEKILRSREGWLTVVGLVWLKEGENTVGSAANADVRLPESAPEVVGVLDFHDGTAEFRVLTDEPVTFNNKLKTSAKLRDDIAKSGPTVIRVRDISFFVIRRENQFGVRIKDANSEARKYFAGRHWFPINPNYRVAAKFTPHPAKNKMMIENSLGTLAPVSNPGTVEFDLLGEHFKLEIFQEEPEKLWLIFRDATSGVTTYPATRYLKIDYSGDPHITIDFNQAYHPPCAFTNFATCPFPPRQNRLPIAIEAGERL